MAGLSIPNIISIARMFLVPVVVWLIITGHMATAFWMFVLAGISDGVDGFIAKRFDQETELGAYLDPLADKALLMSIYVALGVLAHIPPWLVILVVSRDVLIIGAVILSWMMDQPVTMSPLYVSKVNTTGQIVLAALVLANSGFELNLDVWQQYLVFAVGALTVASGGAYLFEWFKHMAAYEEPVSPMRRRVRQTDDGETSNVVKTGDALKPKGKAVGGE